MDCMRAAYKAEFSASVLAEALCATHKAKEREKSTKGKKECKKGVQIDSNCIVI